jgi:hypothetical protein
MALKPAQPLIQFVTAATFLRAMQPGREAAHSPSSAAVKECVELYLHSPRTPSWHGVQLERSTRNTLTFTLYYNYLAGTEV